MGLKKAPISGTGERNGAGDGNDLSSFGRTGTRKPLAYRRSSARLSLVVKPAFACSLPFYVCGERNGAGDGNRTRIKSLGSSHSTIELYPLLQKTIYIIFNKKQSFYYHKIFSISFAKSKIYFL